jgi:peptidoglycan/LPS O-acetylase OafA/YrhL
MLRTEPRGHYLPTLDGWRAIAISMVVASHAGAIYSARDGAGGLFNLLTFRLGTFGVMLFFAISGFLICTRLLIQEETAGSASLRPFYVRRVFRILPAAYVYLAAIGMLAATGVIAVPPKDVVNAAFFLSNYIVAQSWFTGHFWSLALEEHFYLLWPPLLVKLGRRRALGVALALIAVTVLLRYRAVSIAPPGTDLPGYTHLRLDAFMFPCILAILLRKKRFADRFTEIMTPPAWCGLLLIVAAGIAFGALVPAWREPQRLLQSAALPAIVATTVMRPQDWFGRLLRLPALEWLGRVSYSVYLWQQLAFGFAPSAPRSRMIALPFLLAAILLLAQISRRWIELPLIALGNRFAARFQQHSGVGVTARSL